ncbi:unnamed protein product [Sphenostylis stenocarpa]|uniref:Uncharacterized protein n=1 Tax=Sphenostylis stenocarpa TaxID=92480 RepID=A0AA86VMS4_9FABA|nr:unnamed protein product [Sphenostylis stenocarpa]
MLALTHKGTNPPCFPSRALHPHTLVLLATHWRVSRTRMLLFSRFDSLTYDRVNNTTFIAVYGAVQCAMESSEIKRLAIMQFEDEE